MIIDSFTDKYRFLSNFSVNRMTFNGWEMPTWEHGYNAMKSLDPEVQAQILAAATPREAKKLGQHPDKGGITILRPDWSEIRIPTMRAGVQAKFDQHEVLVAKLLATGDATLIEGNFWHDNFWGDCRCKNPRFNCQNIVGENNLGLVLMELRDHYRKVRLGRP